MSRENYVELPNLDNIDFYVPEISSMNLENPNIYLNDKQLGSLARHVLINYWCKYSNKKRINFGKQMNHLKDLLINYRTEQILASMYYYLVIRKNRVTSIGYLKYPNVIENALAYFRAEALKPDSEYNKRKREEELEKFSRVKEQEEKQSQEEREKIKNMSDEEWIIQQFINKFKQKG